MLKQEFKKEFIFGIHPVIEAIKSGREVERLLIQKDTRSDGLNEIMKLAAQLKIPVVKVPAEKLSRITRKVHQGVICFLSAITYASLDHVISDCFQKGSSPLILVLDRITDVRNFGAIARSAHCMGAHAIVVPEKGNAQINSDAVKTSSGALHHIPVCRVSSVLQTLKYLKDSGLIIIACSEKGNKNIAECDMKVPVALLLGSEENGIQTDLLKLADEIAFIPMAGKVSSLNVSVAAGIALYEVIRQRM
ncbi:MAG: 23S rRNA (guanosine(2251)-2'-O)-methyltransferase RlmB [Cytophagaceae bacterium]|nr:23S rRNA (guanosine(2251)-2'-O)-methyltransferase RlmB [Cytophagaceae bacterium]MDW8456913.1 23S rRNA (guanosine(2251)-2'-O)-methyltransferase RlmB [Cytophagaceae bacterium]